MRDSSLHPKKVHDSSEKRRNGSRGPGSRLRLQVVGQPGDGPFAEEIAGEETFKNSFHFVQDLLGGHVGHSGELNCTERTLLGEC